MIKEKIKVFLVLMLMSVVVLADDDDQKVSTTIHVQGGKLIKEKQEIEVYDYHSGTYYSVHVYREPETEGQPKPEAIKDSKSATQTRP